ncbi:MAG: hypothetical protein H9897_02330 [Candidatus Ureaplasma intestinipullorum]|uniref:Lipoprotein n=1 Tax=Candidatus Ureaplasma intestinipullorum TaxID=2838770 RepID=A0A9E2KWZ9_9BACT|nr:hypothetical protein [Candidatus Ureaplasma intestinipullorum]
MSKLKWLKFGLSMAALGVAAVTLPIALTSCNGDDKNGEQDSNSVENGEQAFRDAVQSSGLLDLEDFSTPANKCVYDSQNQPIDAIKTYFINKMSGTANKITVNSSAGSTQNLFQCTMSKNTATYFGNLFKGTWENTIGQSQNNDLKNIKQLSFGFQIGAVTPSNNPNGTKLDAYKIYPKFLQFSWESANKPSWLQGNSIRIQLESGKYTNIVYVNKSTFCANQSVQPAPTDGGLVFINQLTDKVTS